MVAASTASRKRPTLGTVKGLEEYPPPDAGRVVIEACADNGKGKVEITVRDSGHGIPAGIADKVFGPLFTTKPEGMGIGLTLSRTIVEAHGGQLWTDKSENDGAFFHFTLQRA
jgi:two-component system sensor kinase FixL